MTSLKSTLITLDKADAHIDYDIEQKIAYLFDGTAVKPVEIGFEDLMVLFENGWISRYDTSEGRHRYHVTETGRVEARS